MGLVLTDAQWAVLEPLIEVCRPHRKTQHHELRQCFIRWARLGAWEHLLLLAQERGVELGLAFLDGTTIRAPQGGRGC